MPEAAKRPKPNRGDRCLNCGLEIASAYCPDCGQQNTNHNHGLWQFLQEFLEEFIRFDSKLFRTLRPLMTKPGFLTQEWVAGRRVSYITPLKLYITLSALCFLAFSISSQLFGAAKFEISVDKPPVRATAARDAKVAAQDTAVEAMFRRKLGGPGSAQREKLKSEFVNQLPTTNFVLMPVIAAVFWLLYFRQKRFYVEHLVFTLHFYSFAFLLLGITALIPIQSVNFVGIVVILIYLFIGLRRNYDQSFLKTGLKLLMFGAIYIGILLMALFGTLVFTALQLPDLPVAAQATSK